MKINNDIQGKKTLDIISGADRFNKWMFDAIIPYAKGNILEIGSGTANISKYFIKQGYNIFLSDINKNYVKELNDKFSGNNYVKDVFFLDISDKTAIENTEKYHNYFDTIVSLNVFEHVDNDKQAINNCYKMLKKGGKLITLVPSHPKLYCKLDKNLKHFRRYSVKSLKKIMQDTDFTEINLFNFNFIGIFGWYFSGKILGKDTIPKKQMGLYNTLVPLFKILDLIVLKKIGLSIISINKK